MSDRKLLASCFPVRGGGKRGIRDSPSGLFMGERGKIEFSIFHARSVSTATVDCLPRESVRVVRWRGKFLSLFHEIRENIFAN